MTERNVTVLPMITATYSSLNGTKRSVRDNVQAKKIGAFTILSVTIEL